jgi:uncharacterized RDD family membrane protein YckC
MSYPPASPQNPYPGQDPYQGQPAYGPPPVAPYLQYGEPPYGAPGVYGSVQYATWIQRVGAYLVDGLCAAPFYILAVIFGRSTGDDGLTHINALYFVFYLLGLVLNGYNRWYLGGKTGQSWGKKALGLHLVGEQTGQPIGPGMAFVRDLAHIVDAIICYIGFLFPLWDAKKQTLADKIVKTLVIK